MGEVASLLSSEVDLNKLKQLFERRMSMRKYVEVNYVGKLETAFTFLMSKGPIKFGRR